MGDDEPSTPTLRAPKQPDGCLRFGAAKVTLLAGMLGAARRAREHDEEGGADRGQHPHDREVARPVDRDAEEDLAALRVGRVRVNGAGFARGEERAAPRARHVRARALVVRPREDLVVLGVLLGLRTRRAHRLHPGDQALVLIAERVDALHFRQQRDDGGRHVRQEDLDRLVRSRVVAEVRALRVAVRLVERLGEGRLVVRRWERGFLPVVDLPLERERRAADHTEHERHDDHDDHVEQQQDAVARDGSHRADERQHDRHDAERAHSRDRQRRRGLVVRPFERVRPARGLEVRREADEQRACHQEARVHQQQQRVR